MEIQSWKMDGMGTDETVFAIFEEGISTDEYIEESAVNSIDLAITDNYYSAILEFLFALETGRETLLDKASIRIDSCLSVCSELSMLPQWWVLRVTRHMLSDLWGSSFHNILPRTPNNDVGGTWDQLRWLFIITLYNRQKSEIDLWPSQIEGASRAVLDDDDLVVSLPTSAGKTRIAELCILRCLSIPKRVLFITPLRALSAQTESSLRRTFVPLGKTVSSLYGSMGTSDFEQDVLKTRDIIVGTPEKLDFALRNDPSILDDIALVVLDEGHMIGINEREVSYEIQVQRLLQRHDANQRRVVCLSAILPSGEQFDDFVNWIRQDKKGNAIQSKWRPTDLRYGEIIWQKNSGRINFTVGQAQPFIPNYIQPLVPNLPAPGIRTVAFPKNAQELTLAAAWRLVEDDHTVLIYCPQRSSVEAFASRIVDLFNRGALSSVLTGDDERLRLIRVLGREWLGENHPIVKCLDIGVAIHHGALPTPFRKEMERLLGDGILSITVSSPTLAQGLNLSATAIIMHSLYRSGEVIDASEFKNVIGRAGRAFIDTHGLVLHTMFNRIDWRRQIWNELIQNEGERDMESGLALLVHSLISRMADSIDTSDCNELQEYVLNNAQVWDCPSVVGEDDESAIEKGVTWANRIASLDTGLLSLLGESEILGKDIPIALDEILQSSLWERRLSRQEAEIKSLYDSVLSQRAKYIWNNTTVSQRKGYFLAGVGLTTGQQLDEIAKDANQLLVTANACILNEDVDAAVSSIIQLAELIFEIEPFTPTILPDNWREVISAWLKGRALSETVMTVDVTETLRFIEDGLVYRLSWGCEAIRVRGIANKDIVTLGMALDDFEMGLILPCIENGTLNQCAALLMQAGFSSRSAAIYAVESTSAKFSDSRSLKTWLKSDEVQKLYNDGNWPSSETSELWHNWVIEFFGNKSEIWRLLNQSFSVNWNDSYTPSAGSVVRVANQPTGVTKILEPDGAQIGEMSIRLNYLESGSFITTVDENPKHVKVHYTGYANEPFAS